VTPFQRRPGRSDEPSATHVRARRALAERLDSTLPPVEAAWLDEHLVACVPCTVVADEYKAQRLELRLLRDRMPEPPRDLWARTAAAIESESRFRDTARRRRGLRISLAPVAVLSAAVAVAVIAGSLTSSQRIGGGGTARPTLDLALASSGASAAAVPPGATPVVVAQKVEWIARSSDGYRVQIANVDEVCPPEATDPCDTAAPEENHPVVLQDEPASVWGSPDGDSIIVVNRETASDTGSVSVVPLASDAVVTPTRTPPPAPASGGPTRSSASPPVSAPPPSTSPTVAPSGRASLRPSTAASTEPSDVIPSVAPSTAPTDSPAPSVSIAPSAEPGTVEIARDVLVVGQSAAYSPDGDWFAFTARPADKSTGPDIYVWRVGDALAKPATSDHRSVFASWTEDAVVGSTVVARAATTGASDLSVSSFVLDPATRAATPVGGSRSIWRPAVDPTGRQAVYWSGSVRALNSGYAPDAGRLVLGPWSADQSSRGGPSASAGTDSNGRTETTIAAGRMDDWDARWDDEGTHLAVWIADPENAAVGRLSLYRVDAFDGRIDMKEPLLDAQLATAGFSISRGKLVWAEPSADGSAEGGRIQVLAWTDTGSGQVESLPGPVIVIR
jgi:hypothetical protein